MNSAKPPLSRSLDSFRVLATDNSIYGDFMMTKKTMQDLLREYNVVSLVDQPDHPIWKEGWTPFVPWKPSGQPQESRCKGKTFYDDPCLNPAADGQYCEEHIRANQIEEVVTKGKCVFSIYWDTGSPLAGAQVEQIYKYQGQYWTDKFQEEMMGPFTSFVEALEPMLEIGNVTEYIECTEMGDEELAERLVVYNCDGGETFTINGRSYTVLDESGALSPTEEIGGD